MPYSEADRDMMIRTIYGEAADQSPEGQAAVAHVILTRANSGKYGGKTPTEVVLAPGQFEPWQTRSKELSALSPKSKSYQRIGQIVDKVISGEITDPTWGATHFLDPAIVRQRRGGTLPNWAQGRGMTIGDHTFYYPDAPTSPAQQRTIPLPLDSAGAPMPDEARQLYLQQVSAAGEPPSASRAGQPMSFAPSGDAAADQPIEDLIRQFKPRGGAPATSAPAAGQEPEIPLDQLLGQFQARPEAADVAETPAAPAAASGNAPGIVSGVGRALAEGIPVVGALPQRLNAATYAALSPLRPGDKTVSQAPTWYERYLENFKRERGTSEAFAEQHPVLSTGANVVGGVAGTLPLAASAPGAKLLGLVGKTLGQRAAAGAASGAGIGALDAAARTPVEESNDLSSLITGDNQSNSLLRNAATGAATGGALGAAAPAVGKAVSSVVSPLVTKVAKPVQNALSEIINRVQNPAEAAARLRDNPRLQLVDVEPTIRTSAQGLIGGEPEAHGVIANAITKRADEAKDAVKEIYSNTLGKAPDVVQRLDEMKAAAREVGKKAIEPALKGTAPVDVSPVLSKIEANFDPVTLKALQEGKPPALPLSEKERRLWEVHKKLAGTKDGSRLFDADKLHEIQSALRVEAETLGRSATGSERLLANDIRGVRNDIVGAIDEASGKSYKKALGKYADEMGIQDAFEKGMGITQNRAGMAGVEDRPEAWAKWIGGAKPEEVKAAREGALDAINQKISSFKFAARRGTDIPETEFNQQKLEHLFGKEETARLMKLLRDQRDIAETNARILHNSKTAETQEAQKSIAPREVTPMHLMTGSGPFGPMIAGPLMDLSMPMLSGTGSIVGGTLGVTNFLNKGVTNLAQRIGRASDLKRNVPFARLVTDAKGKERNALISLLEQRAQSGGKPAAPGAGSNALSAIISRGMTPAATPTLRRTADGLPYYQASEQSQ